MTRCLTLTLTVLALMLMSTSARADVQDKVKEMQPPADSKDFAMKAAEGSTFEVKLAQLAQQKASSDDVKQLAKRIEQDHTTANNELMAIAKQKNINLPTDLKGECQEKYEAFQKIQGREFDNAYVLDMIKDHLKDIMMFQTEARSGTDQDIKQWASKQVPVLREHATMAVSTAQSLGFPVDVLTTTHDHGARPAGSRIQGTNDSGTGTSGTGTSGTGTSGTGTGTSGTPRTGDNQNK